MDHRLALLAKVFAVDVCAYAIMTSPYHVVVRLAPVCAGRWSAEGVVERLSRKWFRGTNAGKTVFGVTWTRKKLAVSSPLRRLAAVHP